jgi:predicted lipase
VRNHNYYGTKRKIYCCDISHVKSARPCDTRTLTVKHSFVGDKRKAAESFNRSRGSILSTGAKFSILFLTKSCMTNFDKVQFERVAFWKIILKTALKRLQQKHAVQDGIWARA